MYYIVSPLVSLTEIPLSVGTLLMQGYPGPMRWLAQPEYTMDRRLPDGLRAGTKVLQENKWFKTKQIRINCSLIMSESRVAILVCTTFFVVASSILLVACRRSGTFLTGVVAVGAARLAEVVWVASGGLDACSAELLAKVGNCNLKFGMVLKGNEELGVGGISVGSECTVGHI